MKNQPPPSSVMGTPGQVVEKIPRHGAPVVNVGLGPPGRLLEVDDDPALKRVAGGAHGGLLSALLRGHGPHGEGRGPAGQAEGRGVQGGGRGGIAAVEGVIDPGPGRSGEGDGGAIGVAACRGADLGAAAGTTASTARSTSARSGRRSAAEASGPASPPTLLSGDASGSAGSLAKQAPRAQSAGTSDFTHRGWRGLLRGGGR